MLLLTIKLPHHKPYPELELLELLLNSSNNILKWIQFMFQTQLGETINQLLLKLDWNVKIIHITNQPLEVLILKAWSILWKEWKLDLLYYSTLVPITQLELIQPQNNGDRSPLFSNKMTSSPFSIVLIKDTQVEI